MSAKKTSGPSKPRSAAIPKRGRPTASHFSEKQAPPTVIEETEALPKPRKRSTKTVAPETELPGKTTIRTAARGRRKKEAAAPENAPATVADTIAASAEKAPVRRGRKPKADETTPIQAETPKRKAGRPRKVANQPGVSESPVTEAIEPKSTTPETVFGEVRKKGRGRPRKETARPETTAIAADIPVEPESSSETEAPKEKAVSRRGRPRKIDKAAEGLVEEPPKKAKKTPTPRARGRATQSETSLPPDEQPAETQAATSKPRRTRKPDVPAIEHISEKTAVAAVTEANTTEPVEANDLPLFSELGLAEPIMLAIRDMGYERPTPIQAQAIPQVLAGHDVLGVAQTGTGKTASFTLPMLEKLSGGRARARMPRSLILEPTRELALQVAENFKLYGKNLRLNHALLIGGESMADQRDVLNRGVDVLIATPGRLLDLFKRGGLLLSQTSTLVIDEADRMLDMGFIPDIEQIVSLLPQHRQTLFFSATMAPEIRRLADTFLKAPVEITVSRPSSVATTIKEALLVVDQDDKKRTLRRLLRAENVQNAIVFCNRKRDVDMLHHSLSRHGLAAGHLHGDLTQSLRTSTLERFKTGELKILVCSDVAARGIDISGLSHVFNYDLPFNAEDYVHRIGRTGRAGNQGHAFSIATPREKGLLDAIEKLTGKLIATPEFPGIKTVEWASEEELRSSGGRHARKNHASDSENESHLSGQDDDQHEGRNRRKRKRGGKNRDHDDRHDSPRHEILPSSDKRDNSNGHRTAYEAIVEPASFENETPKTGFGSDTPAFMLLPRRRRVTVESENDLSQPVQHDAKHYGEH